MRKETHKRLQAAEKRARINLPDGPDPIELVGIAPGKDGQPPYECGEPVVIEVERNVR